MKPSNSSRKFLLMGVAVIATSLSLALISYPSPSFAQEAAKPEASSNTASVRYQTVSIDGVDVFYREAGSKDAPAILLLHGFPTSSHMYRNLISALADKYRVIAPDYPGFGQSAMPDRAKFSYTFDNYAKLAERLTEKLEIDRYALYLMD